MKRCHSAISGRLGEAGQSSVEFVLTFMLLLGFLLFFFQLTMLMAWGNYVHYATFMAARAYLSAGPGEDQQQRALQVLVELLKKPGQPGADLLPTIGVGVGGGTGGVTGAEVGGLDLYQKGVRNYSWLLGVRYTFNGKLLLVPFGGGGGGTGKNVNLLTLVSESFLGQEPSGLECEAYLQAKGGKFDNGC